MQNNEKKVSQICLFMHNKFMQKKINKITLQQYLYHVIKQKFSLRTSRYIFFFYILYLNLNIICIIIIK